MTSIKPPEISVKLINGTPYIKCSIELNGSILSLDKNLNYSELNTLKNIEQYTNSYLEQSISSYLYKTSKEYKSDIDNFGKYVIYNYLTWNDWIESDWLYNYQNAFFSIDVNTTIENGQLYTKI